MLAVEAMDLAHRGQVGAIALVSDDRDFTPLALRLREMGLDVLGFGTGKATQAFRAACTSFAVLDTPGPASIPSLAKPAPAINGAVGKTPKPAPAAPELSAAERQEIVEVIKSVIDLATGQAEMNRIGSQLALTNKALFKRLTGGKGLRRRLIDLGVVEGVKGDTGRVRQMVLLGLMS